MVCNGSRATWRRALVAWVALGALSGHAAQPGVRALTRVHPGLVTDTALGIHYADFAASDDGRSLAFASTSVMLVDGFVDAAPPDALGDAPRQIYLFDVVTRQMTLVSHAADSLRRSGNASAWAPSISDDGRSVAFLSAATDLVPGQTGTPGDPNTFLYDRQTGLVALVSHTPGSASAGAGGCGARPVLSPNGAFVAYASFATGLVTGQVDAPGTADVFVYDVATGQNALVSRKAGSSATAGNGSSSVDTRAWSADGARLAFLSRANDLIAGHVDANGSDDAFVYTSATQSSTLVSHAAGQALRTSNGRVQRVVLARSGAVAAWVGRGTDVVAGQVDTPNTDDAFVTDLASGATQLASHKAGAPAVTANNWSGELSLAPDGARLAFGSYASDLVAGATSSGWNGFLFERATGQNLLVTRGAAPVGIGLDALGNFSGDGRYLALSTAGNPGGILDVNGEADAYVFDRLTSALRLVSTAAGQTATTGNRFSITPWLSADGARVAFLTGASDMLANVFDSNMSGDLVVDTGSERVLVTRRAPGTFSATVTGGGHAQAMSDDGRQVVVVTPSNAVLPGVPTATNWYGYLVDRRTGATRLATHKWQGPTVPTTGYFFQVSGDGRAVAFASTETDVVAGQQDDNDRDDAFLYDAASGLVRLISHAAGQPLRAVGQTIPQAVSRDGRFVLLSSASALLQAGVVDTNNGDDVYLYDGVTDAATLISHRHGSPGTTANARSSGIRLSSDGRFALFTSAATDLVAGSDTNAAEDVYLWDRLTGVTSLVSHSAGQATSAANQGALATSLSADGRFVAFSSRATDLVAGQADSNGGSDVFLYDRVSGTSVLISHAAGLPTHAGDSSAGVASVSADGRYVAFASESTNLVPGLSGVVSLNVYRYDRQLGAAALVSHAATGSTVAGNDHSGQYLTRISSDGARVVFPSWATNLVAGQVDSPQTDDLFVWSSADGSLRLVNPARGTTTTATGQLEWSSPEGFGPLLPTDASAVVFASRSDALVEHDLNRSVDAFVWSAEHVKGDLDGDGNVDLVLRHTSQPVQRVWRMDDDANRLSEIDVTPDQTSAPWQLVGVDDFDGDLQSDLIFHHAGTGAIEFWLMDGSARRGAPLPLGAPGPPPGWNLAATADFDQDGRPDLLWQHPLTRQLMIYTLQGVSPTGAIIPSPSSAGDANWQVAAAFDMDVDGSTDLLWYNTASGRVVWWRLDAQARRITGQFTEPMQAGNSNWKVLAAGDFGLGPNGLPNTRDLVWRNDTSGRFVLWHMDAAGRRTSGRFTNPAAPVEPLDWTLAGPR